MTTYAWPSTVTPNDMSIQFASNAARYVSPFSGVTKAIARDAALLQVTMQFRFLRSVSQTSGVATDENARSTLMGFLAKLNGPEHQFTLPMFIAQNLGAWGGSPLVNGAGQTGSSLIIDAVGEGSVTAYAFAGDWFEVNGELKICTATAHMNSDDATLEFWPPLREAPANNAVIDNASPTGVFILMEDPAWAYVPGPAGKQLGSVTVTAIEYVYA